MKVLVIGSGGREHALAWSLSRAPSVREVLAAPGNAGIAEVARCVAATDLDAQVELAREEAVDLVVVGPEVPLAAGIADRLRDAGIATFGPGAAGARLEASKSYAKDFMRRHGVPTAGAVVATDLAAAREALARQGAPIVVKDAHLAAGKGVTVAETIAEAEAALAAIFDRDGAEVVLEEKLVGQELSLLVVTDGNTHVTLPVAQDYKQAEEGDTGPMTGGMGTVAPVRLLGDDERRDVEARIVEPTLAGLRADGTPFRGVLFLGLMRTDDGVKVLEYNVRFGDPETQVALPLLEEDLGELLLSVAEGRLGRRTLRMRDGAAACVVLAAPGYPGRYPKGVPLGLPEARETDTLLFHAGTTRDPSGALVSDGGRVLNAVALDSDIPSAVRKAYRLADRIDFPGARMRRDIGRRLPTVDDR